MYFCFRWLLILFKREFSFPEIMRIWEVSRNAVHWMNLCVCSCVSMLPFEMHVVTPAPYLSADKVSEKNVHIFNQA